ncbi:hypothetical protein MTO96_012059 [Rhipicephalus appendiculatus]
MAFPLGWQLTAALIVSAVAAHASWTRLLTDVIPGLRTMVATPETTLNETVPVDLHPYDQAVQDLLDSILAAHNLPSDSGKRRGKRSTSLDVSIKDSLGKRHY